MMFKKVLDAVDMIRVKRSDNDHIDRLNHRWTSILLVVASLLLTTANYGSLPMFCWCPAYFVSAYEKYAQKICWVSETYNIVDDRSQSFPAASRDSSHVADGRYYDYSTQPQQQSSTPSRKKVLRVSYYQWIPLLLLLQSFLFYLPGLVWKTLAARSGLDLANIVEASDTVQNAIYPERREKTLRYMSRHINRFLTYQNNYRGGCCSCLRGIITRRMCFCCGNRFGNYLSCLYLGLKTVNLVNIVLQVLFIDFYLGSHFHLMGVAFLHGVSTNQTIETATAIASNHPSLAHVLTNGGGGNTGYAAPNAGHMVKRDLERVGLDSANESLFKIEIDISALDLAGQEIPFANESLFRTNVPLNLASNRPNLSSNRNYPSEENRQIPNPGPKLSNKTKRDDRSSHNWSQRSERRKYRKRPSSVQYDWSTYMASLKSFPYLSSKLFPKITYCDFTVRQMTTFQLFTTQCVLSINFINEKLFLLLWFWFCLLFFINLYSITIWSVRLCSRSSREDYVRRQLAMIQRRLFLEASHFDRQLHAQRPSLADPAEAAERKTEPLIQEADPSVDVDDKTAELQPLQTPQRQASLNRRLVKFEEGISSQERSELSYEQAINSFIHCRLKQDGIFILKILATNTTRLVELDVLALLWSVHERRLATGDPYYHSDRRESLIPPSTERRDTIVDVTELRRAKTALSEHDL